jgi:hypothetical protein
VARTIWPHKSQKVTHSVDALVSCTASAFPRTARVPNRLNWSLPRRRPIAIALRHPQLFVWPLRRSLSRTTQSRPQRHLQRSRTRPAASLPARPPTVSWANFWPTATLGGKGGTEVAWSSAMFVQLRRSFSKLLKTKVKSNRTAAGSLMHAKL